MRFIIMTFVANNKIKKGSTVQTKGPVRFIVQIYHSLNLAATLSLWIRCLRSKLFEVRRKRSVTSQIFPTLLVGVLQQNTLRYKSLANLSAHRHSSSKKDWPWLPWLSPVIDLFTALLLHWSLNVLLQEWNSLSAAPIPAAIEFKTWL